MVLPEHLPSDLIDWENLTWAYFGFVDVHALAQEKLVSIFNSLVASTEQALACPESLEVAVTDPLGSVLFFISERCLEAMSLWQVLL